MNRLQKQRLVKARQHHAARSFKKLIKKDHPEIYAEHSKVERLTGCWRITDKET